MLAVTEEANEEIAASLAELERWKSSGALPRLEMLRRRQWLLEVPLFSGLDQDMADAVALAFTPRVMKRKAVVIEKGTVGEQEMYFVANGEVEVLTSLDTPAFATLGVGKFFGETALLESVLRNAYIQARRTALLYVLRKSDLKPILRASPGAEVQMGEALSRHMAERAEAREAADEIFEGGQLWRSLLEASSSDEDDGDDAEDGDQDEEDSTVLPRFKALAVGVIRAGIDMDSAKVGNLIVGEEITALSSETVGDTLRVKFSQGWVSVFAKSGKAVLEVVIGGNDNSDSDDDSDSDSEEEANVEMAAALTEAGSWKQLTRVLLPQPEVVLRREWVQAVPLFSGLDESLMDAVARAFTPRVMKRNAVVIEKGTVCEPEMYFVAKGEVEMLTSLDTPAFATLGIGKFFGETALLEASPHNAYIQARKTALLYVLRKSDLKPILKASPRAEVQMGEALARHMAERAETREAAGEMFEGGQLWRSLLEGSSDEDDADDDDVDEPVAPPVAPPVAEPVVEPTRAPVGYKDAAFAAGAKFLTPSSLRDGEASFDAPEAVPNVYEPAPTGALVQPSLFELAPQPEAEAEPAAPKAAETLMPWETPPAPAPVVADVGGFVEEDSDDDTPEATAPAAKQETLMPWEAATPVAPASVAAKPAETLMPWEMEGAAPVAAHVAAHVAAGFVEEDPDGFEEVHSDPGHGEAPAATVVIDATGVIMRGWLCKHWKGTHTGHRQWFELKSDGSLTYADKKGDIGKRIPADTINGVSAGDSAAKIWVSCEHDDGHGNHIGLMVLECTDGTEAFGWMQAFGTTTIQRKQSDTEVALADDMAFAFDLPEPETTTQLRLQIDLINGLQDTPDNATEGAYEYVYRCSFPLEKGTPTDAFWSTLQLKAAEANRFVDVIAECAVKHSADLGFVRDIVVKPAPGVEVRATERVFIAEDSKAILYRERTDQFCCLNELSVVFGTAVFKGTYVYPAPTSRADFLTDNEAMFKKLQLHANGDQPVQEQARTEQPAPKGPETLMPWEAEEAPAAPPKTAETLMPWEMAEEDPDLGGKHEGTATVAPDPAAKEARPQLQRAELSLELLPEEPTPLLDAAMELGLVSRGPSVSPLSHPVVMRSRRTNRGTETCIRFPGQLDGIELGPAKNFQKPWKCQPQESTEANFPTWIKAADESIAEGLLMEGQYVVDVAGESTEGLDEEAVPFLISNETRPVDVTFCAWEWRAAAADGADAGGGLDDPDKSPVLPLPSAWLRGAVLLAADAGGVPDRVQAKVDPRILTCQAYARGRSARRALKSDPGVKWMKTRKNIIKEIVKTEQTYVEALQMLVAFYSRPSQNFLTHDEASKVFSNIEMILPCQSKFLDDLRTSQSDGRMGQVFVDFAPYFKMYNTYVANFENSMQMIVKLKKRNAEFVQLLESQAGETGCGKGLEDLLITPVQRIPRYRMLLDELRKHTAESHVDYGTIRAALDMIRQTADTVNAVAKLADQQRKVISIHEQLSAKTAADRFSKRTKHVKYSQIDNLVKPHRYLSREGSLLEYSLKQKKTKTREFFLFNDMLLKATRINEKSLQLRGIMELNEELSILCFPSYWDKGVDLTNCAIISSGKDTSRSRKVVWYICFDDTDAMEVWSEEMEQFHSELLRTHDTRCRAAHSSDESVSDSDSDEVDGEAMHARRQRARVNAMYGTSRDAPQDRGGDGVKHENPLSSDSDDFDEWDDAAQIMPHVGWNFDPYAFIDAGDESISSDSSDESDDDEDGTSAGWLGEAPVPAPVNVGPAAAAFEVEQSVDTGAVVESVTFTEPGSLGLKFVDNPHTNVVQLKGVNLGTQAEGQAGLTIGAVLTNVGDTSVVGMSYTETIDVMKRQGRPVALLFGPVQPLPDQIVPSPKAKMAAAAAPPAVEDDPDEPPPVAPVPSSAAAAATPAAPAAELSSSSAPSDLSSAELLEMAESVGFDAELLQDIIDGRDGDTNAVVQMLIDQGAALPAAVVERNAPPAMAELLKMAESIGLDQELLQDFLDGVDSDVMQVASMLTDQGAATLGVVRAQTKEVEVAAAAAEAVRGSCTSAPTRV